MWSYLSKSLRVGNIIQTLNTMMAAGMKGEGDPELPFNGCRICVLRDENIRKDG